MKSITIGDSQITGGLFDGAQLASCRKGMYNIRRGIAGLESMRICEQLLYNQTVNENETFFYIFGTNDNKKMGWIGRGIYEYQVARCIKAMALYAMIPDKHKIKAQSQAISYSGTWLNSSKYGGNMSKQSSQNGSTATFLVKGNSILIATSRTKDATTNKFSVIIDGISVDDIILNGGAWWTTYIEYTPQVSIYSGLDDTMHTVVLTSVVGADVCCLDWIVGILQPLDGLYNRFFMTKCLPIAHSWAGKIYDQADYNIIDADVVAIDNQIVSVFNELQSLGFYIKLIDISDYNPDTSDSSDGVHASQQGHNKIGLDFIGEIL